MREILVFGDKNFKISIEDGDKITFGPWAPPRQGQHFGPERGGTLRVYRGSKENIVACFSGVYAFRDLSLDYSEEVAREEGAVIWKSDKDGYQREEKLTRHHEWIDPVPELVESNGTKRTTRKK